MIKTLSRTQDTILVVDDTGVKTARADHPKWPELNDLFSRISYQGNDGFVGPTEELLNTMDLKTAVETYTVGRLSVNALGVTYANRPLHTIDAERVMAFMRDKQDYRPLANYMDRKMKNPSSRAIAEMYNFLEHRGMPLTLKGTFIAYKGVTDDGWSIMGNKNTVVIQGEVDSNGKIKNTVGSTIEVERSSVDDDFRKGCSHGLHVGSLEYARGWGRRVVYVEVDPADVVSVPEDCGCQKLRCCKYTVVGEYTGPLPDTVTTEFDDEDVCHYCGGPEGECDCENENEPCSRCGAEDGQCDCDDTMCSNCNRSLTSCECRSEPHVSAPPGDYTPTQFPSHGLCPEHSDIYNRVVRVIAEQLGIGEADFHPKLTPALQINDPSLGMDSLDGVELTMAFEEEFGFEIPDEVVEKYEQSTIGQIVKDIADLVERSRARTVTPPTPTSEVPWKKSNQDYDIGWADGQMQHGIDRGTNLYNPRYIKGDETGSDSASHADYIRGYVAGYNS